MNTINFDDLELEYLYSETDILYDNTDIIKKRILQLPEHEKRILLIYIEYHSFRKVAKVFNCSHSKISYILKKIIDKITK